MAFSYFAELDENNTVIRVIALDDYHTSDRNDNVFGIIGATYLQNQLGGNWKQTFEDGSAKGLFAGVGYTYLENVATLGVGNTDVFIEQKPAASWTLDTTEAKWNPPLTEPTPSAEEISQKKYYEWDEDAYQADNTTGWVLVDGM